MSPVAGHSYRLSCLMSSFRDTINLGTGYLVVAKKPRRRKEVLEERDAGTLSSFLTGFLRV